MAHQTHQTAIALKHALHDALGAIDGFDHCALLDYPDYLNLGDHLIWLGSVFYLADRLNTKIAYAASAHTFSAAEMEASLPANAPILLNGGGNLGDLWVPCQRFREQIIQRYRDRPIVILPQSIYFTNPANLARAAEIFNGHPNLTLFTRDQFSYDLAHQHFDRCRVLMAPDMVFHLAGRPELALNLPAPTTMLYHCRTDRELNRDCLPIDLLEGLLEGLPTTERPKLVVQDWASYDWVLGTRHRGLKRMLAYLVREGWQRGLTTPQEWRSRQTWLAAYPHSSLFSALHCPEIHRQSWSFFHSGLYQFQSHRLIITNRLHGHILATLLGIPHIFLPNSYHKNEAFYRTWTKDIPFCRFVADPEQIPMAIAALLNDHDGANRDAVSPINAPVNATH